MAYMCQTKKTQIAPAVKAILKRYGVKGTLAVRDHSTLALNIKSGTLDFLGDYEKSMGADRNLANKPNGYLQVNTYHYRSHFSSKVVRRFLDEVIEAMNIGNHDNSDSQRDYFDVGWYININIGKWNTPYILEG
jgi:hypothetical protein